MAIFSINNIALKGIASCVPKNVVKTKDYDGFSALEKKMFEKTVGVTERRVAEKGITASDLCYEAAFGLLKKLNWSPKEVEVLIFVSQSSDYYLPATSVILQNRLGLSKNCMAFDINLGCSGYVYGLSVIGALMSNGHLKKGLLLVGDVSSAATNSKDKSTFPLFGDAGTATAIEFSKGNESMVFNMQSDGSGYESIIIPHGGGRNPISKDSFIEENENGLIRSKNNLWLNGIDVFNFSLKEVAKNAETLLASAKLTKGSIDFFVLHQANKLINESVRKKMKIDVDKCPYSIGYFGNTSSASIPLTITTQLSELLKNNERKLFLSGFGVGFSWGSVSLSVTNLVCLPLLEI